MKLRCGSWLMLLVMNASFSDAPNDKAALQVVPALSTREDTSRFEVSPHLKRVDLQKTGEIIRVIVKASGPTECYKQREIERTFEKNVVKIVMRLKKPQGIKECPNTLLDYEEKVFESSVEQAPAQVWILGYEGWHKVNVLSP